MVATPNDSHFEICMAAIEAGKHILAEKPLALNAKQATEMYQAAEAKGIKQYAGSPPRSQPRVRRRLAYRSALRASAA